MNTPIYDQLVTDFRHGFRTVPGERDEDDRHTQLLFRMAEGGRRRKPPPSPPADGNTAPLPPVRADPPPDIERIADRAEARIA